MEAPGQLYGSGHGGDYGKCRVFTKRALEHFRGIKLMKVESPACDGGLEITPMRDGEDDLFDIHSIKGIEHFDNLRQAHAISMINDELIEEIKARRIEVL